VQVLSLIWGIVAIIGMFVAFFPCLGSLNWLNIPFAMAGLVFSIIALATARPAEKGGPIAGVACCSVAVLFGLIRLIAGGGLL